MNLIFTQFELYCQVKVLVFDLDLLLVEAARDATARFSETAASGCSLSCPRAEVAKVNTTLVTCLSDDESYVSLHDFCSQLKYRVEKISLYVVARMMQAS